MYFGTKGVYESFDSKSIHSVTYLNIGQKTQKGVLLLYIVSHQKRGEAVVIGLIQIV